MTMKKCLMLCMFVLLVMSFSNLFSEVKNQDKPLKGQWDFQPQKVWMVGDAGDEPIARPQKILVADDGTIYVYDMKNSKFYSFTNDGKYISTFCPRGEGPGELKRFMDAFMVKNTLIVADVDRISYFGKGGKYIRSVNNNFMMKGPNYFINEDEFIYFPLLMLPGAGSSGKIYRYNLKTQEEKVLAEFDLFKGGKANAEGARRPLALVIPPLTPMVNVGYGADNFYWGVSGNYNIHVVDYNGKQLNNFSVDRSARQVSKEVKEKYFKMLRLPPPPPGAGGDMAKTLMKSYPNDLTHFYKIGMNKGLIYVYLTYLDRCVNMQEIDVFSPDGKYLYNSKLNVGDGYCLLISPHPVMAMKGDFVYMGLEDKEGEPVIAKFKIQTPKL